MGKEAAYIGRYCEQRIREPENLATQSSGEGTQPEAGKAGDSVRGSVEGSWLVYPAAYLLKKTIISARRKAMKQAIPALT